MITRNSRGIAFLAMVAILFIASGCGGGVRVGDLQTESENVELGGAASVRVEIEMAAGELEVSGGATELLEASFTYNVAELKPEVNFSGGTLSVRTPEVKVRGASLWDLDEYRNEWDLRLKQDVPMDLRVELGAGRANLKLGGLALTSLDVQRGAGEVTVDLSGPASPARLTVSGGAGSVTVNLSGAWQNDLQATVEGGLGNRTLILPKDVGVRVKVEVGVGGVDAIGLTKEGEYYTNDAYGKSDVTLNIQVDGGVGETELRVGE